jgi:hypothetical protein
MKSSAGKTARVIAATLSRVGARRRTREGATSIMCLALVVVVVAGAALRLWQYAANTSMWFDEIALADGILTLNLRNLLTSPLPYNQVAPKGFLLVQKLIVAALGRSDYALRLFPLVCSLIALVVFVRLATRMLDGAAPLAAVILFATATPLIASSNLAKQYSTDVCVAVLLWWIAYELASRPVTRRRAVRAALLGSILVWFSHPGVLMATALGASLAALPAASPATKGGRRTLAPILICWAASSLAVAVAAFACTSHETREYMRRFWAAGFAPVSRAQFLNTLWPWDQIRALFGTGQTHAGLGYPLPLVYALLTAAGLALVWRRNRRAAVLLTTPLVLTLCAAIVRQYPFGDRLILFLIPGFMLAIAAAIEGVRRLVWPASRALGALATAGLLLPTAYAIVATPPPVYVTEDMKPVLSYVQARRQSGDGIYVYYGAAPAVTFYATQYGLARGEYAVGGCHRADARRYLRELDTFRGRSRVWILLTHTNPYFREREDILAYLDAIGTRTDGLVSEPRGISQNLRPAEAYLYDLSDDDRLRGSSADSFQLTGPPSTSLPPCDVGPQSMVQTDFEYDYGRGQYHLR